MELESIKADIKTLYRDMDRIRERLAHVEANGEQERLARLEADLKWIKWFTLAQATATIGMLFKLFVG